MRAAFEAYGLPGGVTPVTGSHRWGWQPLLVGIGVRPPARAAQLSSGMPSTRTASLCS